MSRQKLALVFRGNAVIVTTPIDEETEKSLDELLKDVAVSKCHIPCG
jgi:hypothetical protein